MELNTCPKLKHILGFNNATHKSILEMEVVDKKERIITLNITGLYLYQAYIVVSLTHRAISKSTMIIQNG